MREESDISEECRGKLMGALEKVRKMVLFADQSTKAKSHRRKLPNHKSTKSCRIHNSNQNSPKSNINTKNPMQLSQVTQSLIPIRPVSKQRERCEEEENANIHYEMLERELAMFRTEVEIKYHNSLTNTYYQYPRRFPIIDDFDDAFNSPSQVIPCSIYERCHHAQSYQSLSTKMASGPRAIAYKLNANSNIAKPTARPKEIKGNHKQTYMRTFDDTTIEDKHQSPMSKFIPFHLSSPKNPPPLAQINMKFPGSTKHSRNLKNEITTKHNIKQMSTNQYMNYHSTEGRKTIPKNQNIGISGNAIWKKEEQTPILNKINCKGDLVAHYHASPRNQIKLNNLGNGQNTALGLDLNLWEKYKRDTTGEYTSRINHNNNILNKAINTENPIPSLSTSSTLSQLNKNQFSPKNNQLSSRQPSSEFYLEIRNLLKKNISYKEIIKTVDTRDITVNDLKQEFKKMKIFRKQAQNSPHRVKARINLDSGLKPFNTMRTFDTDCTLKYPLNIEITTDRGREESSECRENNLKYDYKSNTSSREQYTPRESSNFSGVHNINIQINNKIKMKVEEMPSMKNREKRTKSKKGESPQGKNRVSVHHLRGSNLDSPAKLNINVNALLSAVNLKASLGKSNLQLGAKAKVRPPSSSGVHPHPHIKASHNLHNNSRDKLILGMPTSLMTTLQSSNITPHTHSNPKIFSTLETTRPTTITKRHTKIHHQKSKSNLQFSGMNQTESYDKNLSKFNQRNKPTPRLNKPNLIP